MDRRAIIVLAAAGSVILLFPLASGPAAAGMTLPWHPKLRQGVGFASGAALLASVVVGLMAGIIALDAVNAPTEESRRETIEAVRIISYLGIATVIRNSGLLHPGTRFREVATPNAQGSQAALRLIRQTGAS